VLTLTVDTIIVCAFITVLALGLFRARPTSWIVQANQAMAVVIDTIATETRFSGQILAVLL